MTLINCKLTVGLGVLCPEGKPSPPQRLALVLGYTLPAEIAAAPKRSKPGSHDIHDDGGCLPDSKTLTKQSRLSIRT
ncbi:hypothetical protein Cob_v003406 [Colletotrichum orbiculare MAFF 240422]|uniref:Uncharacterized protein n=1 Tax=Colletotrichum orbiculare (strain 104-T / ATCC 96160 / CBS 514.97 / LARS 414 / MAFF 240422) TaxID=1213857 RepID=A0A484G4G6_COLOR|nr:hypothetical protein Cob_v003406 [Colletotrichum orbiculare MAFF 240422]